LRDRFAAEEGASVLLAGPRAVALQLDRLASKIASVPMECDAVAVSRLDQILTDARGLMRHALDRGNQRLAKARDERGVVACLFKVAGEVYEFIEGVGDDRFADIPPHRNCWPTVK
jgi:hypothetical protein